MSEAPQNKFAWIEDSAMGGVEDHGLIPRPRSEGDREVTLQSLIVHTPEDPMVINDDPFGFGVNLDRLGYAVNVVRKAALQPGRYEPRALSITLGDSLPSRYTGQTEKSEDPVFNFSSRTLNLTAPRQIADSSRANDEIAGKVQGVMNRDLLIGLQHAYELKDARGFLKFLKGSFVVLSAVSGDAAGVVLANGDGVGNVILGAGGGAAAGAGLAGSLLLARTAYNSRTLGDEYVPTAKRALARAKNKVYRHGDGVKPTPDLERYFKEPIITLEPRAEPETS
jgi:hypothetical protein